MHLVSRVSKKRNIWKGPIELYFLIFTHVERLYDRFLKPVFEKFVSTLGNRMHG